MQKETPIRKCIVCNKKVPRSELIKITKSSDGEIRVSPDSKFFGYSYYICKNSICVENAFKKGRIFKLLKVIPDETIKEKIRAVLES